MKNIIIFFCLISFSFNSNSQVIIDTLKVDTLDLKVNNIEALRNPKKKTILYKTYEDYVNDHGQEIGMFKDYEKEYLQSPLDFICYTYNDSGVRLTVKYRLIEYWGFTIGDDLFRIHKDYPCYVYDIGKVVYYESGTAKLNSLCGDIAWTYNLNSVAQFSLDLESKIVGARKSTRFSIGRRDLLEFCRCINDGVQMVNSRKMMKKSNNERANAWIDSNRNCIKYN